MVLQSSGLISLNNIKTEFNGIKPIKISNYYKNAITNYTNVVSSLPNIGNPISFKMFYGKSINIAIINDNGIISYINLTLNKYTFINININANATIQFNENQYCELLMVGGGGSTYNYNSGPLRGGGGGGNVLYKSNYLFNSGLIYNIFIGNGGINGNNGGETYISCNSTKILSAIGGSAGTSQNLILNSVGGNSGSDIDGVINTYYGGNGNYPFPTINYAGGAGAMQNGSGINEGNGYTSSITGISDLYGTGGNGSSYNVESRSYTNFGSSSGGFYGRGSAARLGANIGGTQGCIIIKLK
jgi:hypothetical protein